MQLSERFVAHGIVGSFRGQPIFSTSLRIAAVAAMLILGFSAPQLAQAQANGKIAYTQVIAPDSPASYSAIFTFPGGQLTHPSGPTGQPASDRKPAWSPDGKKIAFIRGWEDPTAESGPPWAIIIADADGSNERIITRRYFEDGTPAGNLALCTPQGLSWRDDTSVAFVATCNWPAGTGWRGFYQPIDGPVSQTGGLGINTISSPFVDFGPAGAGPLYACYNQNLPINLASLFCVWFSGQDMHTALEKDPPDGITGILDAPRWKYSARGPNVAFITATNDFYKIYTITPSFSNQQPVGTDLNLFSGEPEKISCTAPGRPTVSKSRYGYDQIAPSPDGRFIAVRRWERTYTLRRNELGVFCGFDADKGHGIFVMRNGGGVQTTVALGQAADPAWQPSSGNLTVTFRYLRGDEWRELRGMQVDLLKLRTPGDDTTLDPTGIIPINPAEGQYQFEDVPPGEYRVRATLKDTINSAFDVRYEYGAGAPVEAPVNADFQVVIDPEVDQVTKAFRFGVAEPALRTSNVGDSEFALAGLESMAAIYDNLIQFTAWAKDSLLADLGPLAPVHAFATRDPYGGSPADYGAAYFQVQNRIILAPNDSVLAKRDENGDECPMNCEWHEYAHRLDVRNRTVGFDCSYLADDSNHGGYANSSTCDSLLEGIAIFLPAMFANSAFYAGFADLQYEFKAWQVGAGSQAMEDFAVASLLWDLVDLDQEVENTEALLPVPLTPHGLVSFNDGITFPLPSLWQTLGTGTIANVRQLRQALPGSAEPQLDLDSDGVNDVNIWDLPFLMHGFYPTLRDTREFIPTLPTTHPYHYDIGGARREGLVANAHVGLSSHFGFNLGDLIGPAYFYREKHPTDQIGNLGLSVRDASGTPLAGADVHIDVHYPGSEQRLTRHLLSGDGKLVPLHLPQYFDYLPQDGAFPTCDANAGGDLYVSATVTAELNGYSSTNAPIFDNCTYLTAAQAAGPGAAALSYTLEFPEDSTAPTTTAQTFGAGQVFGTNASVSWTVDLKCSDPEVGGFASGCRRTEYILDGGPVTPYLDPFTVTETGSHVVEFRSVDAAANEEAFHSISFTVGLPPAPTISSFTPASGAVGTAVTITGSNFTGATAVQFNGGGASFTVDSATQITAIAPNAATGPITVTAPGGTATSSTDFTVIPAPFILGFSPTSGNVGSSVTIGGNNFIGATRVAFNGVSASFTVNSSTQVTALVPVGATTGQISMTGPGGTGISSPSFVVVPLPTITGFSPAGGSAGTSVTITGTNLDTTTSVRFSGVGASFTIVSSTQLTAVVPAGAVTGYIVVVTPGGGASSATQFVVFFGPTPSITSVSPTSGSVGTEVTIKGTNLNTASAVYFNGTAASFRHKGPSISATVPAGATTGPITVTTEGGIATSPVPFVVDQPPIIWGITEVYSSADGSVQYVELFTNQNMQDELINHTLKSNTITYTFPTDLDPDINGNGNDSTANRYMLIATPAFASQPGAVPPDFTFAAANFMSNVADTINFAENADTLVFGSGGLPTNGVDSLHEDYDGTNRHTGPNTPTNFAGQVGSLPEPSGWQGLLAGTLAVFGLARRARRRL